MMFQTHNFPLFMAVSEGRLDLLKQALEQGADVHATDHRGRAPLYYAISKLDFGVFGLIPVCSDADHSYAIHPITRSMNIIKELLKRGANPNRKYDAGSFLEWAVRMQNLELVKELIKHGAEIDIWDDYGHSLLHTAVWTGDLAVVETLLKAGADVNIQNNSGAVALLNALNDTQMVKMLLKYGANCNVTYRGINCLSFSLRHCKLGVIQELLKHGADTSKIDKLYLAGAIVTGHRDVIRELLQHGVEFSEVLPYNLTVRNRDIDMAMEFFKHRVSICTKDRNCETVLDSIFASAVNSNSDILTAEYPTQLIKYAVLVNFANDPSVVMESKNDDAFIEHFYEHYCRLLSCFFICEAELKEMSSFRVNESFTLYDVTLEAFLGYKSKPVEYGQDILNQILILLKQSKFPVYEECVISAVNKAQLVHKLMEYQVSLKEPNCDTKGKLLVPINVIDNVGDYLSNKDLINWLWAMKDL